MDVDPISDIGSIEYDYAIIAKTTTTDTDNIKNNILLYGVDSYKVLIVDNNALNRKKLFERYLQNCSDNYIG